MPHAGWPSFGVRLPPCDEMRIVCSDDDISIVDQSALLRSAVLSDMHQVDPEGCVRLPCDTKTWRAWLTDDPSPMTAETIDLFVSVIKVRPLYTRDLWMLAGASACSIPWVPPRASGSAAI
jgi:hypothetical protein